MSKDDWLLRNESNKAFFIAWLVYIPIIVLVAIVVGLLIREAL